MSANKNQQNVIENINGIFIVDAGAGTGKTYTITQRYLNLLENKVEPKNILMITFTKNAAFNMKEKVISKIDTNKIVEIIDAPIINFDSFCFKIVQNYGLNSPQILGINQSLNGFKLLSEQALQNRLFTKFYNQFLKNNKGKYEEILVTIKNPQDILSLIENLLCKGIYPTKDNWFLDSEEKLKGNFENYKQYFSEQNEPIQGKTKLTQSKLKQKFDKNKQYLNLPEELVLDLQINPEFLKEIFEDNSKLIEFVHNIYIDYIEFMIKNNIMTFSLISMFAFLILHSDENIRKQNSFEYILVDEFQDTNEMQFMLILLLLKKSNLCVVGDWKQGIYGFRNANINNILEFKEKIVQYKNILNQDKTRIDFDVSKVTPFEFDINYRSSQKILDFSKKSLITKASKTEEIDKEYINKNIVSLSSNFEYDDSSNIEFFQAKDKETEIDFILNKIQDLIKTREIKYFDSIDQKYKMRKVEYKDIAILSKTRKFGLKLQKRAIQYNIPAIYEGGIELFSEQQAILLLAWLKLLINKDNKEALITILEKENYNFLQIKYILENEDIPEKILDFRENLIKNKTQINYICDEILKKYNFSGPITNKIITVLEDTFSTNLISLSDLILFIEENIENNQTYNIEIENSDNSVTIQTIHASKGLEYPIVFIVNCNIANFPGNKVNTNTISFHELVGLRNKNIYSSKYSYLFDNWKTNILNLNLFSENDEQRRLLYVAITRAMYDVYITAYNPSEFFNGLAEDFEVEIIEEAKIDKLENNIEEKQFEFELEEFPDFIRSHSVHELMTFKEGQKGRGIEFGNKIHHLAFRYSQGLPISMVETKYKQDFENVKNYIDSLNGEILSEIDCALPLGKFLIKGIIDLVVINENDITIVDWKTDLVKDNLGEYKKQLSIYYHVLRKVYIGFEVKCVIFWTHSGEVEEVNVVDENELIVNLLN